MPKHMYIYIYIYVNIEAALFKIKPAFLSPVPSIDSPRSQDASSIFFEKFLKFSWND